MTLCCLIRLTNVVQRDIEVWAFNKGKFLRIDRTHMNRTDGNLVEEIST